MITSAILDEPRLGTAVPGGAGLGLAWRGRARQGDRQSPGFEALAPARGMAMPGWLRSGKATRAKVRRGEAWQGFNGVDEASAARPGRACQGDVGPGTAWLGAAGNPLWTDGVDKPFGAGPGLAVLGVVRHGPARLGEASVGLARCGLAMRGRDVKQRLGCDARASHATPMGWAWHRQLLGPAWLGWARHLVASPGKAWNYSHLGRTG